MHPKAAGSAYQLMWGSKEVVGGISHEVDTGGAVEVCKPIGHDSKVCQPRSWVLETNQHEKLAPSLFL